MKLPKDLKRKIINDLLPLLQEDAQESQEVFKKTSGFEVAKKGVTHDLKGQPIIFTKEYYISFTAIRPVNHVRRMLKIMELNANWADIEEDLSRYLVKWGKSKEAITDSINNSKQ